MPRSRRLAERRNVKLLLKNLLFTLLVPGTVAVYLPLRLAHASPATSGPMSFLGCALLATGAAVYAWCVFDFATFGRGTPAPIDAPKKLVVRGLYRYTRNPMYVGVLTVILGWSALFRSATLLGYALVVAATFTSVVVWYEEPHLEREFDEEYRRYKARVRRWI